MVQYFIRRFLLIIPTFLGITMISFGIMQIVPGGPLEQEIMKLKMGLAAAGEVGGGSGNVSGAVEIPEEALAEMRKFYGFDKPIPVRYATWLWNILHFDLGRSYKYGEPVWDVIKSRFPISIYFGLIGFILSYSICIPLGIMKAVKHGSTFDFATSFLVFLGYSTPGWALGAILLVLFGGGSFWDVFPLGGFRSEGWEMFGMWDKITDQVYHTILPVIAYTIGSFATLTVLMKNSLMEQLGQDYVRTAFAKGLSEKRVVFLHALRNSLIPIATGLGHFLGIVLAGSYLIEYTFNINGFGLLGFTSVVNRDYPIVLGVMVISSLIGLLGNIISDILYAIIDPRIRFR
ncbi:MAG: ABC transporter permease subunit [bacterium]|nr:ABC transporter permease subunit [bacterium]